MPSSKQKPKPTPAAVARAEAGLPSETEQADRWRRTYACPHCRTGLLMPEGEAPEGEITCPSCRQASDAEAWVPGIAEPPLMGVPIH